MILVDAYNYFTGWIYENEKEQRIYKSYSDAMEAAAKDKVLEIKRKRILRLEPSRTSSYPITWGEVEKEFNDE